MTKNRVFVRARRVFIAGLVVLVPAAVSIAVLAWLFQTLDGLLGATVARATGVQIPGLGLVATLALVMLLGLLSTNVLGRRLVISGERLLGRIPVVRSIYGASKGVLTSLADRPANAFKSVVLVEYPRTGVWSLAFVTGSVALASPMPSDALTLFVPSTPNPTSGFLIVVRKADVTDLNISVEEAVRVIMSGGILRPATWAKVVT